MDQDEKVDVKLKTVEKKDSTILANLGEKFEKNMELKSEADQLSSEKEIFDHCTSILFVVKVLETLISAVALQLLIDSQLTPQQTPTTINHPSIILLLPHILQ